MAIDAATALLILRNAASAIELIQTIGGNAAELASTIERARAEGRPVSDAELLEAANSRDAAIDRIRGTDEP